MNATRYYVRDSGTVHGPLNWEAFRSLLASGTVATDAQWLGDDSPSWRGLNELVESESEAPPKIPSTPPAIQPVQPPRRKHTARNVIAIVFSLIVSIPVVLVIAGKITGYSVFREMPPAPVRTKTKLPKATARVFTVDGMIYLENTTTNVWQGGELIIDPIGERYRIALGAVPPNQLLEFPAADFATLKGDRFPVAAKVPRMVSVQPAGMESSVYTLR